MAPFQYDSYRNPYVGSIGDLILRRGEIAARQAESVATAQARAAETRGQAWAGAVGNIAQTVAAIPQQIQQGKRLALADEVREIQLKAARREDRSQSVFETELKNPKNYHEDGTIDDDKITAALRSQDVGAWQHWTSISAANRKNALDTAKTIAELQNLKLTNEEKQRAGVALRDAYLGKLAFHGEQVLSEKSDDPLHARDTTLATVARAAADGMISEPQARAFIQQTAQASPNQLRQVFASFVPPDVRESLDKERTTMAKTQAETEKAQAEAANLRTYGRTTPGTPEEQYLTAITRGDQATADRVLKTIRDTANAKKDPAATALATQLAGLRADEARARLDTLQKKNEALDVEPDVQTTVAGRRYIDLSSYQGEERNRARKAASDAGAIGVSKEQANALQEIDNARLNQRSILDQITDLLPKGVAGRGLAAAAVPLEKLFQSNDQIAAFNSWRTAAIQTLRATAGSKGLRINKAEIEQAIENDIPKLTDIASVARQKVKNIETMLENAEQTILVRDRSVRPATAPPTSSTPALTPGLQSLAGRQ